MILVTITRRVKKDYVKFRACLEMLEPERAESLFASEEEACSTSQVLLDGGLFVIGTNATLNEAKQLLYAKIPIIEKSKTKMKSVASVAARGQSRAHDRVIDNIRNDRKN